MQSSITNIANKMCTFGAYIFIVSHMTVNAGCAKLPDIQTPPAHTSILRKQPLSAADACVFYSNVMERIAQEYVEPVDNNQLLEGALNGMLQALDPHSAYLDPVKFLEIQKQTHGQYGGLGMEITMEEGLVKIVSPIEDSPAYKAGLQTGDLIVLIDDEPVYGLSIIEASNKMKGEPHTKVRLGIRRQNLAPFEIELTRENIKIHPVKWRVEDKMGYLRITTFNEHTTTELKRAIADLHEKLKGAPAGILIDVRNNAGGLLDQAVEATDLFLKGGNIVSICSRDPSKNYTFKANGVDFTKGVPIVVLINGGSASASEILAGALQDHKRGLVVGTDSFGKGTVQTVIPMTNGGALKLTTAHYETPSGRSIQKTGIKPDVVIEQQVDLKSINEDKRYREANLQKALNHTKSDVQQPKIVDKSDVLNDKQTQKISTVVPVESQQTPSPSSKPAELQSPLKPENDQKDKAVAAEMLKEVEDYQLTQAFNILRALIFSKKT